MGTDFRSPADRREAVEGRVRSWDTDGSVKADTRYPVLIKWAFRQGWVPDWALSLLFRLAFRRG